MTAKEKPEDLVLSDQALALIEKLPEGVKPVELHDKFPRIFNRIAKLWRHPDEIIEYLDELIVDRRGKREGFPLRVALDLTNIKDHYESEVHPDRKQYLWDPRKRDESA